METALQAARRAEESMLRLGGFSDGSNWNKDLGDAARDGRDGRKHGNGKAIRLAPGEGRGKEKSGQGG
jgi:hypothetical protein